MTDDDTSPVPATRLRPAGAVTRPVRPASRPDSRPVATPGSAIPERPAGRAVPVRAVLLLALAVLLLLAVVRSSGLAAVVGVPLALVVPGAVLQPRFLPGLRTDVATSWCLRVVLSVGTWALVGLAVGAAGIPVRSVWTVVVAVVLVAAVVVAEPAGTRPGWVTPRQAVRGAGVLVVVVVLALGGRALVAVAGGTAGPATSSSSVTVAFTDPTTPFALTATGARAAANVVVTNAGTRSLHLELTGAVGRGLPWTSVGTDVPAGASRIVVVAGAVPVCSDPQQAVVRVEGTPDVPPLSAVLAGTDGAPRCGAV